MSRWRNLRRYSAWFTAAAFGVVLLLLAVLLWRTFQIDDELVETVNVEEAVAEILAMATPPPATSALVYRTIIPSLVIVQATSSNMTGENDHGFGAGVVINNNADVLTALHVVEEAAEIQIYYSDGSQTSAFVTNADPDNDIAVLTPYTPPGLVVPGPIGNADAIRVGDEVFAVGHPLGLTGSISAGVVSGLEREFMPPEGEQPMRGLIQFDAAVNPGNSGGPLLDRRGQVVGIVTGAMNPTEQEVFIGIGFAVPIEVAAGAAGGPEQ